MVAESITFDVDATGEIQRVELKDARIPETPDVPQTGDFPWLPAALGLVAILSAAAYVFLVRKARRDEDD